MQAIQTRYITNGTIIILIAFAAIHTFATTSQAAPPIQTSPITTQPNLDEVFAAKIDLWGEYSLCDPDGPSYELFRDLLPPLRYVNTAYRYYPILLSAPGAETKARLVSNGSAINARAGKSTWRDWGVPATFFVGKPPELFGQNLAKLNGPHFADGYHPIVQMAYHKGQTTYEMEAFAPVEPELSQYGAVMVRLRNTGPATGQLSVQIKTTGKARNGTLFDENDHILCAFDSNWQTADSNGSWIAELAPGDSALLTLMTRPAQTAPATNPATYEQRRQACIRCWDDLLGQGIGLSVPEPVVMDAWRSLIIGTLMISVDNHMNYSAGNSYERLCEGESGDAVRALMLFGHPELARRMIGPLLDFDRHITRFHIAGLKLDLLSHYYWITRDADYVLEKEPVWQKVVDFIAANRDPSCGLVGKDNYAADIHHSVFSFKSNANCFRGLHNLAAVLKQMGKSADAERVAALAADLHRSILDACERSMDKSTQPPFIPMALLDDEKPYDPLTATRTGCYYNIICPYVINSGVFDPDSPQEQWLLSYQEQHGGLVMGLLRSQPRLGTTVMMPGINPMYSLRRLLTLLRRDERDKALIGFYGHLAHGLTRDTFIGGEGNRLVADDPNGRGFYMPPNCTSNALFLLLLRNLLVQDWDMNNDGVPETLRLLYAAPRRWMADGCNIRFERCPTAFGEVSAHIVSQLKQGEVTARIETPNRPIKRFSIRLPLPAGWKIISADVDGQSLTPSPDNTFDLTGRTGSLTLRCRVTVIQ